MATGSGVLDAINSERRIYYQQHPHLSPKELQKGWNRHWSKISAQVTGPYETGNTVPQKRSSSKAQVGVDSLSKRPGHDSMTASVPSSHYLQRQVSAPAGRSSTSSRPAMHPPPMTTSVGPINIPSTQQPRRASMTATSYPRSFNRPNLQNIDEVQAYSPDAFLAQALDAHQTTAILAHSPAAERGEFQLQINSHLAAYNRAFDSPDGKHSPATSDTSLTSASTAPSEPMTRSNTNDVLCFGIDMMRMNSMSHPEQYESEFAKVTGVDDATLFSLHDTNAYHDLSYSVDCFPYGSEMKHSLSQDSNTSSPSVVQSHFVPTRAQELRRLEPKQSHDAALIKQSESPEVKLVERTLEDGTKVMKAEISRSARHQPPRKTTFCPHCNDQPQGFHGEHELNRHIDRQHKSVRKVWVCKDISSNGFLSGCKACRNDKTYGANYNAAAHLRRAHFNPCKNKRGGRGKKSEGRGGMGGGNKPSMDELKHWMYAMYEIIIDGKVVEMRPVPPEGQEDIYAAQVMPVPADMSYDINMTADDYCDFDYSPPAEQMGYDMAAGMSQSYSMMAPPMHTMQVPAQHYGHVSVNYMQMQTQPIYIN